MNRCVTRETPTEGHDQLAKFSEGLRQHLTLALRLVDEMTNRPEPQAVAISEQQVRAVLKWRRNRDRFFGKELFADPAWDILLELLAAELGQHRVSVTSLCAGAAVPATTALRWINSLEHRGLVRRTPDPTDARRTFISLTSEALEAMTNYLQSKPVGAELV